MQPIRRTQRIAAAPAVAYEYLTDVSKLPNWNRAITGVVSAPALAPDVEWRVNINVFGQSWVSKSRVTELDPEGFRFAYRSQSDDGNPSYSDWVWQVTPDGRGSLVSISVTLQPQTFWRKHLLVKVRRPQLRREIRESIRQLGDAIAADAARCDGNIGSYVHEQ